MAEPSTSVVIPVKDGARWLGELLDALLAQAPDEVLVIDSGSRDGSADLARSRGVTVLEIDPAEFGHGRTRNLGAGRTRGELIAFLTQDATPCPGWLDAYRAAFSEPTLGAAFGPHLPRPDTSPMIARELTEFFAAMGDGTTFLSNVNACYRRACWAEVRFDDVPYSEDQAFGRALRGTRWTKRYVPGAGVLHAHDYGAVGFMRRYFDEYRGLRTTTGHVEPWGLRSVPGQVRRDRAWMREQGYGPLARARWSARSAVHHGGRRVFSGLGARAHRVPRPVQKAISLEGTAATGTREQEGDLRGALTRTTGPDRMAGVPASRRLHARLHAADLAAVEAALDAETRPIWEGADADARVPLALLFGVWHGVTSVMEKTGLHADEPPEEVHAMSRGPLSAGGVPYYPDMIAAQLERVGVRVESLSRALDWGCSSGRVTRWFAACYPEVEWHGADPNAGAIGWAQQHLPEASFHVAPQDPPLPFGDGHFDLVLAVSIWSHYGQDAALAWLGEMHRVIRPGGHLWLTTHGHQSIAHQVALGGRGVRQLQEMRDTLHRSGFWFAPEFGPEGDWGVKHPQWGNAWIAPEWLLRHATPWWRVEDFLAGGNADDQDVYLLQRR